LNSDSSNWGDSPLLTSDLPSRWVATPTLTIRWADRPRMNTWRAEISLKPIPVDNNPSSELREPEFSQDRLSFVVSPDIGAEVMVVKSVLSEPIERGAVRPIPVGQVGVSGEVPPTLTYVVSAPIFDSGGKVRGAWGFDTSAEIGEVVLKDELSDTVMYQAGEHIATLIGLSASSKISRAEFTAREPESSAAFPLALERSSQWGTLACLLLAEVRGGPPRRRII
jgi:hypothetical protein